MSKRDEMEIRARFLIDYARRHRPVIVRQLYYAATVVKLPGIEKTEAGYDKIQIQVLALRREGRIAYNHVVDGSRAVREVNSWRSPAEALDLIVRVYRTDPWAQSENRLAIFLEKDALAGTLKELCDRYAVPLYATRGFSSETFAYEAVRECARRRKDLIAYSLYDFDRSGQDAARSLGEMLRRFAEEAGIGITYRRIGLTLEQIRTLDLPSRPPKRGTAADLRWGHDFAVELDAMPPDELRALVEEHITKHLPEDELKLIEDEDENRREALRTFADQYRE